MNLDIMIKNGPDGYYFASVSSSAVHFRPNTVVWNGWKTWIYPNGKVRAVSYFGEEYMKYVLHANGEEELERKFEGAPIEVLRSGNLKRNAKDYWTPVGVIQLVDGELKERTVRFIHQPVYQFMRDKGVTRLVNQNSDRMFYLKTDKKHQRRLITDGQVIMISSSQTHRFDFQEVQVVDSTWTALLKWEKDRTEVKFFTRSRFPECLKGMPEKFEV